MVRRCAFGAAVITALITAGCSAPPPPQQQVRAARQYFADNNATVRQGPRAQQDFFERTQHPDFERTCGLNDMTADFDPAMSTLRPDPAFAPGGTRPLGDVWVVAVEVTTRREGATVGRQVGSQHLVFADGRTYAFAPCLS